MEGVLSYNSKPVFKNQPILCPWVSRQPYPSSQLIKNKLCSLEKRRESILNNELSSSRKSFTVSNPTTVFKEGERPKSPRSNNSHFFYFLRLMQLFPETHPATLHAVLTACKNNFFYAIDKLLYAQKCKSSLSIRSRPGFKNKGHIAKPRINISIPRLNPPQRGKLTSKPSTITKVSPVQNVINLVDKPFIQVEPIDGSNVQQPPLNMVNFNLNTNQTEQQSYIQNDSSVIEIVCYENEQTDLTQDKNDDSMEIETFSDNLENIEPTIGENVNIPGDNEDNDPPVIIVETSQESDDVICINNGGTTLEAISNQNNAGATSGNHNDISSREGTIVELD